tara:strand:+ start:572 stop:1747 length:1176 start_codon:yes stop_codon:yes gene_type:complete
MPSRVFTEGIGHTNETVSATVDSSGNLVMAKDIKLPSAGGIKDSSGNNLLTEAGSAVTLSDKVIPANSFMFRNLMYNGAMQINQRGTVSVSSGNAYGCDRFQVCRAGGDAQYDLKESTDVPVGKGFAKSFHIDITTADASLGASDGYFFRQQFEGQDLQRLMKGTSSAKTLTLSFFVKSSKAGTYIVELYDVDNTRQVSRSYSISAIDTWQEVTLNFPADTTGAFDNDNERSLLVQWWLASGTSKTSGTLNTNWNSNVDANRLVGLNVNVMDSTSNNFYITGVQLEEGDSKTPFEHRPIGMELSLCQRYCQKLRRFEMCKMRESDRYSIGTYQFVTEMRAAPTIPARTQEPDNLSVSVGEIDTLGFTCSLTRPGDGYGGTVSSGGVASAEL